jgi:hypothetical protein
LWVPFQQGLQTETNNFVIIYQKNALFCHVSILPKIIHKHQIQKYGFQDFLKVRNHVTARRSLPTAKRTRRVSSLLLDG